MITYRGIIAVPYFNGDAARAARLLRFMAALQADRAPFALLVAHRYDARSILEVEHSGASLADILFQKFGSVIGYRCPTVGHGWPQGCNAVAFDVFREVAKLRHLLADPETGPLIMLEPDCVPINRDWLSVLYQRWLDGVRHNPNISVQGAWRNSGGQYGHVNGNAVFPVNFALRFSDYFNVDGCAWDAALAPLLRANWCKSGLIANRWNEKDLTRDQIESGEEVPVIVHGVKDESVWNYVKEVFPDEYLPF